MTRMKAMALAVTTVCVAALSVFSLSSAPAQRIAPGPPQLPRGMVAFFEVPNCPPGWRNVTESWRGRYPVIAHSSIGTEVGSALSNGENRPTGNHGHEASIAFSGGTCTGVGDNKCAAWGGAGAIARGPVQVGRATVQAGETVSAGTNAPYVTLRACSKQ